MNNNINTETGISEHEKQECLKYCPIYVRNIISYFMTIIIGFTYVYLQSRNLLNNKHIYISLILQFLNATAVFIKSDTHLNDKLKESNKEIVNMKKDRSASILPVRSDDSLSSVANINRLHIEPIIVHSPISV